MNGDSVSSASSLVNGEAGTMTACSKRQLSDGQQDAGCGTGQSPVLEPKPSGLSNGNSVAHSVEDDVQSKQHNQVLSAGGESLMDVNDDGINSDGHDAMQEDEDCEDGNAEQVKAAEKGIEKMDSEELKRKDEIAQQGDAEMVQDNEQDASCTSGSGQKQDQSPNTSYGEGSHSFDYEESKEDNVQVSADVPRGTKPSDRLTASPKPNSEADDAVSEPVPSRGETPLLDSHPSSVVETDSRASTPSQEVISLVDSSSDENSVRDHAAPSVNSSCVSTPAQSRSVTPSQTESQSSTPVPTRQQDTASDTCSPSPKALTSDASPAGSAAPQTDASPAGSAAQKTCTPAATEGKPVASLKSPTAGAAAATSGSTEGTVTIAASTETMAPTPDSAPSPKAAATPAQSKLEKMLPLSHKEVGLRPMADLLVEIGQSLVCQQVYRDLVKVQRKRKLQNRLTPEEEEQLPKMEGLYEVAVELNQPYHMDEFQCNRCSFHSESKSVLELHKELPHMGPSNTYICAYCDNACSTVANFIDHVTSVHKKRGRLPPRFSQFVCPLCSYEHNSKTLFFKHLTKCHRTFHPGRNCEPLPADSDIPLKKIKVASPAQPRAVTQPKHRPQILKPYRDMQHGASNSTVNKTVSSILGHMKTRGPPPALRQPGPMQRPGLSSGMLPQAIPPGATFAPSGTGQPQYVQMGNNFYCLMMHNGRQMLLPVVNPGTQPTPGQGLANARIPPPLMGGAASRPQQGAHTRSAKPQHMRSAAPFGKTMASLPHSSFHVCEICCGMIRDRESLRVHFKTAHRVEIPAEIFHKKQPYLFCAQCKERFWTYQGLRIHQQKRHKALMSSSRPAAPAQPPPRPKPVEHTCIVCNKEKLIDILDHLQSVHGISVDMQINMKTCMVCGKALSSEPETKEHLQKQHPTSLIGKHADLAPKKLPAPPVSVTSSQQAMPGTSPTAKLPLRSTPKVVDRSQAPYCPQCFLEFSTVPEYLAHRHAMHTFVCSRCPVKQDRCTSYSTRENLRRHVASVHSNDAEPCPICKALVGICSKFIDHVTKNHLKKCAVLVERMSDAQLSQYKVACKSRSEEVVVVEDATQAKKLQEDVSKTAEVNGRCRSLRSSGVHEEIIEVDGEQVHIVQQQDTDSD